MAVDFSTLVPQNNVRLPDALTVRHGSGPLIGRLILEGDRVAREAGIHLRLRHDFDELVYLNRTEVARGNWRPIMDTYNPEKADISAENGFWIAGENDAGEIVTTAAARIYDWPDTTLEDHAVAMFFGRDEGQRCVITTPAAKLISGVVFSGGTIWVRPDYRGRTLSHLLPRMSRAYSLSRWPLDWLIGYVQRAHVDKGIATGYGSRHLGFSIYYPDTSYGEIVLAYSSGQEAYDDMGIFLDEELSDASGGRFAVPTPAAALAHEVTRTSPEGVRQGSSRRS